VNRWDGGGVGDEWDSHRRHLDQAGSRSGTAAGRDASGVIGLTAIAYIGVAEIAGSFAFWAWLSPGMASLALFAWFLTLVDAEHAGRTYAAYDGVYIVQRSCGFGWWRARSSGLLGWRSCYPVRPARRLTAFDAQ
jgi:hypothetical protein